MDTNQRLCVKICCLQLLIWTACNVLVGAHDVKLASDEANVGAYWERKLPGAMPPSIRAMLTPLTSKEATQLLVKSRFLPDDALTFCKATHIKCVQDIPSPKSISIEALPQQEDKESSSKNLIPFYQSDDPSAKNLIPFYQSDDQSAKNLIPFYQSDDASAKNLIPFYQSKDPSAQNLIPFYQSDDPSAQNLIPFYQSDDPSAKNLIPFYQSKDPSAENLIPFYQSDDPSAKNLIPFYQSDDPSAKNLIPFYQSNDVGDKNLIPFYQSDDPATKNLIPFYQSDNPSATHVHPFSQSNDPTAKNLIPFYQSDDQATPILISPTVQEVRNAFREKQVLVVGAKIYIDLASDRRHDVEERAFLPRKLARLFPFDNEGSKIASMLKISKGSLQETIQACEAQSKNDYLHAEVKACLTSLEDVVDFVSKIMGSSKPIKVYDSLSNASNVKFVGKIFTILNVESLKQDLDEPSISCHDMDFPFRIFYCHYAKQTKSFVVTLQDKDGSVHERIVNCHYDTSYWNPHHVAFKDLQTKPGVGEICHWLGRNWMEEDGWLFLHAS